MGFLEPRTVQLSKRYPAPSRCGVRVPVPRVPTPVRPMLHYGRGRGTSGGNPVWREDAWTGSAGNASGPGGAANPTPLTAGYPGYYFDRGDSMSIGAEALTPTGDPIFTMASWVLPSDGTTIMCPYRRGTSLVLAGRGIAINVAARGVSVEFGVANGYRSGINAYALGAPVFFSCSKTPGAINTTTALYVNGIPITPASASANTPNTANTSGVIGYFSALAGDGMLGNIYEIIDLPYVYWTSAQHRHYFESTRHEYGV